MVDFGHDDADIFWLAMELLEGETLRALLSDIRAENQQGLEPHLCVSIADGVLCALIEAHACALVHRDLRPSNVFLHHVAGGETVVKLFDFGMVKDVVAPMTGRGEALSKVSHMAPEQIQGREIDGRADLYSLGVVLYECMTGELPFNEASDMAMAAAHLGQPVPPIAERTGGKVTGPLAAVIERALAKSPDDRWSDAVSMRDAVLAAAAEMTQAKWTRFDSQPGSPPLPSLDAALQDAIWDPRASSPDTLAAQHLADLTISQPGFDLTTAPVTRRDVDASLMDTTPSVIDISTAGRMPEGYDAARSRAVSAITELHPDELTELDLELPPHDFTGDVAEMDIVIPEMTQPEHVGDHRLVETAAVEHPDTVVGPLPTEASSVFQPEIKAVGRVQAPGAISGGRKAPSEPTPAGTDIPPRAGDERMLMSRRRLRLHMATTDIVIRRDWLDEK